MKYIIATLSVTFVLFALVFPFYYAYGTDTYTTFTVNRMERVVTQDSSKYLVFTDSEVFENTDSLLYWKFNSSDVYGQLEIGKTYKARVYGWRIKFLSNYRNIIEIKETN